jgi:hypothetical protein
LPLRSGSLIKFILFISRSNFLCFMINEI